MQDRIPLHPGRVRLTPVEGQDGIYDLERADEPLQIGTPLNKENLLTDTVATFLGLTGAQTPAQALEKLSANLHYEEITETSIWTVPAGLVGGKIFAMVVGGGGSGCIHVNASDGYGAGGGSGHIAYGIINVIPGDFTIAQIGAGGAGVTGSNNGNAGGATRFYTLVADGGSGGNHATGNGGNGGAGGGSDKSGTGGSGSFGGSGGSYGASLNAGAFGGAGGSGSGSAGQSGIYSQQAYKDAAKLWKLAAYHYGIQLTPGLYKGQSELGAGAKGGYGGNAGHSVSYSGGSGIGGGGGGYCADGGDAGAFNYGGGGGLFFGNAYRGGAGGFFADGDSEQRGAGSAGGYGSGSRTKNGGNGVIGIWYFLRDDRILEGNL